MLPTPMTVGTLRAALASLPHDFPVVMSSDGEGNEFHRLYDVEVSKCSDIDGECESVHSDDIDDYDPDELTDAVVLWP